VQNRLSPYFRESIDQGVVDECARERITFLAYSPLGGRRLAKKIPNYIALQTMGQKYGVSPFAVVIAWVRSKGSTVLPIPGASKPENARSSASAAEIQLTNEEITSIDAITFRT
jgi:aryl-alcohol dehydrogenase-like predicted oxidoreductase